MNYTKEEQDLIVLSSFPELTHNTRCELLSELKIFVPDLQQSGNWLIKRQPDGVYNKVREKFFDPAYRDSVFSSLSKRGIECVTLASDSYPQSLRHIPDPPLVLYCKGRIGLMKTKCLAIVGSRRSSVVALKECRKFSKELSRYFTIVSGSADGADSAALEGAEAAISVIAYGFDYIGRASNAALVNKIAETGLIISEYPPETEPRSYFFPVRNRIIAGLTAGTLVVSAAKKSGALITADYAAEYGREVFAFPHNVGVGSGAGCNELIKNGAYLCQNPLDIFEVFGLDLNPAPQKTLTEDEQRVYSLIKDGDESISLIAAKLGVPPFKLIPVLSSLEIKGLVIRLGGNRYSAV